MSVGKMYEIYTVQLPKRRFADEYGIPVLDITVKSGHGAFAPTWDMVYGYKNKELSESEYTELYYELMRQSYRNCRSDWLEVLRMPRVALACYCPPRQFCHRILLAQMLTTLHERAGNPVCNYGELLQ